MQAIFLDRDGVINRERADYVKQWSEFEFLPGVLSALRALAALDLPILVVSNQSAIGRGLVSQQGVDDIHWRARTVIEEAGGRIDEFLVCPHRPDDGCACRKPRPGLLLRAAKSYNLTMADCFFVGDALTDFLAAQAAGCRALLVKSGRQGTQLHDLLLAHQGVPIVPNLEAAARHLFAESGRVHG
jgi:D-glycero-D-manno-heptose 1,7-bisphosphate phosphatase